MRRAPSTRLPSHPLPSPNYWTCTSDGSTNGCKFSCFSCLWRSGASFGARWQCDGRPARQAALGLQPQRPRRQRLRRWPVVVVAARSPRMAVGATALPRCRSPCPTSHRLVQAPPRQSGSRTRRPTPAEPAIPGSACCSGDTTAVPVVDSSVPRVQRSDGRCPLWSWPTSRCACATAASPGWRRMNEQRLLLLLDPAQQLVARLDDDSLGLQRVEDGVQFKG
mmetsp:Transcript_13225/g.41672  ORF Transcript_13225/g.41672 Transcript_13225/m.41672 type:complete len:222 (+) Transcript_13225:372-1037(+)